MKNQIERFIFFACGTAYGCFMFLKAEWWVTLSIGVLLWVVPNAIYHYVGRKLIKPSTSNLKVIESFRWHRIVERDMQRGIQCLVCGLISTNEYDVINEYCGHCHVNFRHIKE